LKTLLFFFFFLKKGKHTSYWQTDKFVVVVVVVVDTHTQLSLNFTKNGPLRTCSIQIITQSSLKFKQL